MLRVEVVPLKEIFMALLIFGQELLVCSWSEQVFVLNESLKYPA